MSRRARWISVLLALGLLGGLFGAAYFTSEDGATESFFLRRTTVRLWYDDASLTDFLNDAAVAYGETQNEVRIEPTLITENEYIKKVNDASVEGDVFPDLYITRNNELERCYKGGIAAKIEDDVHFVDTAFFPQAALDAVTFHGNIVAYPLCYETSALLYNREILESMAQARGQTLEETVPKTMPDLISLANDYVAPENVKAVFKWDVSDIFFNYYFVGNYMNMGGAAGDESDQIDVYNEKTIQCMEVYQQLNRFFAVDTRDDDYDEVLQDFAEGKIVFTIATTDAVAKLQNGVEYGVTAAPDPTGDLAGKTMSVTDCVVINAYSEHQAEAAAFSRYMLYQCMGDFYARTGRAPAQVGVGSGDSHMSGFYAAYTDSVPITKLRAASNFWMLLENTFSKIWDGADANDALHEMAQELMIQMTGTKNYVVEKLPDPPQIDIASQLPDEDGQ